MSDKLTLLLRRILREEIRTELAMFKKEILSEIRRGSSTAQPITEQPTRKAPPATMQRKPQVREAQKPKPKFSNDPFLQSLLEDTEPLRDPVSANDFREIMMMESKEVDLPVEEVDDYSEIFQERPKASRTPPRPSSHPLVTEDINGTPINRSNPKVKEVLDVMNMDFSGKLKAMNDAAKNFRQGVG
jgi:hypothetical protein